MRVLVACEFSGVVRRAFRKRGHEAWSCDLLPAEDHSPYHFIGDALDYAGRRVGAGGAWDLLIAHPPCTHLAVSGARWFAEKRHEQATALDFVRTLLAAPIQRIALENPISIISSKIRKPEQIIQPWQFGHGEIKATCLWLKNLPPLVPTQIVEGRKARVHREPPGPERWKNRSPHDAGDCRRDGGTVGQLMSEAIRAQLEHERATWRLLCLATLDQLHAAQMALERKDDIISEMRDERRRLAMTLFGEPQ